MCLHVCKPVVYQLYTAVVGNCRVSNALIIDSMNVDLWFKAFIVIDCLSLAAGQYTRAVTYINPPGWLDWVGRHGLH